MDRFCRHSKKHAPARQHRPGHYDYIFSCVPVSRNRKPAAAVQNSTAHNCITRTIRSAGCPAWAFRLDRHRLRRFLSNGHKVWCLRETPLRPLLLHRLPPSYTSRRRCTAAARRYRQFRQPSVWTREHLCYRCISATAIEPYSHGLGRERLLIPHLICKFAHRQFDGIRFLFGGIPCTCPRASAPVVIPAVDPMPAILKRQTRRNIADGHHRAVPIVVNIIAGSLCCIAINPCTVSDLLAFPAYTNREPAIGGAVWVNTRCLS